MQADLPRVHQVRVDPSAGRIVEHAALDIGQPHQPAAIPWVLSDKRANRVGGVANEEQGTIRTEVESGQPIVGTAPGETAPQKSPVRSRPHAHRSPAPRRPDRRERRGRASSGKRPAVRRRSGQRPGDWPLRDSLRRRLPPRRLVPTRVRPVPRRSERRPGVDGPARAPGRLTAGWRRPRVC